MFQINGWNENFEWNESRRLIAPAKCAHPNRFGRGLRRLSRLPDGAMIYGLFVALCNVNSARRPEQRLDGFLSDDGTASGEAWTVDDFEDFTGFPASDFRRMVEVLTDPRYGWLIESPGQPRGIPRTTAGDRTGNHAEPPATLPATVPATLPASVPDDRQTEQTDRQNRQGGGKASPPPTIAFASLTPTGTVLYRGSFGTVDRDAIVAEINAARRQRDLAELVGHFASVPIDRALREPGVGREMLSAVVRYEFAKYDRAEDPSAVLSHLEPGNMFRSEFLTGTIDRARRWTDDPDGYDWGSSRDGISDAEWTSYASGVKK